MTKEQLQLLKWYTEDAEQGWILLTRVEFDMHSDVPGLTLHARRFDNNGRLWEDRDTYNGHGTSIRTDSVELQTTADAPPRRYPK